jgi:diaminopropionate ammonia-lyase
MFLAEFPQYQDLKDSIGLGPDSQILLINSEGNTDPDYFRHVAWDGANSVPPEYRWSADLEDSV